MRREERRRRDRGRASATKPDGKIKGDKRR
jgi:hypothetical protein